jgi:GntR family phosphonate transport system transcriptional regulator
MNPKTSQFKTTEALYFKIAGQIEEEIRLNFTPGAVFDSEIRLAERFEVNRHTIRKSIDTLVARGVIIRKRGVGLFVAERKSLIYELDTDSRITSNLNKVGAQGQATIIKKYLEPASFKNANYLKCSPGQPLLIVRTFRLVDDVPFAVIDHHFVYDDYTLIYNEYNGGSLHHFIKTEFGVILKKKETSISVSFPCEEDAELLNLEVSSPILKLRTLNICSKYKTPVEYSVGRLRADMVELKTRF